MTSHGRTGLRVRKGLSVAEAQRSHSASHVVFASSLAAIPAMSGSTMNADGDVDMRTETSGNYTILRIKRKRTDEPLDALGVLSST